MKIASITLLAYLATTATARLAEDVKIGLEPALAPTHKAPTAGGDGGGCCESDADCGPTCVKSYGSEFGFCKGTPTAPSPTPPTPAPQPTVGDCPCDVPRTIPTKCEVQLLIELLDIAISTEHKLAGQWLRGSFHDAGTFDQNVPQGGANGCLMNHPPMLLEPENAFLDVPVDTLKSIKNDWEAHPDTCLEVSSADMIQFAGLFAAVRQRVSTHPGSIAGIMDPAKEAQLLAFHWNRFDELNCEAHWTGSLPGFSAGIGSPIPARCAASGTEIKDKMMDRNGFTKAEATALIGAHTIGRVRNTFGPAWSGPWVTDGADNATPDGPVFNNAYHDFLKNTIVENTAPDFAANTAPFNLIFPDWFGDTPNNLVHLDTDVTLAFPPVGGAHPDYSLDTAVYAASNTDFLTDFDNALDKMSKLGVDPAILSPPGVCCPDGSTSGGGGIIATDVGVVKALVRNLGAAEADAEQKLDEKQASKEFTGLREKRTTLVEERVCDEKATFCALGREGEKV